MAFVCVIFRLAILIQYQSVTDTHIQIDGLTTHDGGIYRCCKKRPMAEVGATVTWHNELLAICRAEPQATSGVVRAYLTGGHSHPFQNSTAMVHRCMLILSVTLERELSINQLMIFRLRRQRSGGVSAEVLQQRTVFSVVRKFSSLAYSFAFTSVF